MTREPQLYDTISKGGVFWRVVSIENGIITAKRLHGAGNGQKHKAGRPLKGTRRQIEARGYHFCDIPPVKVSYQEPKAKAEQEGGFEGMLRDDPLKPPATEPETATERRDAGEKEQEPKEPPKTAESAAQVLAEAEEAERLKEDGQKLRETNADKPPTNQVKTPHNPEPILFDSFRVRLISGREHTVRPPEAMTTQGAIRLMVQGTFVADAYGAYFASEQIESVMPIKERI